MAKTILAFADAFSYNPETGIVSWKITRQGPAKLGCQAGSLSHLGYYKIKFNGRMYLAHHIAWYLYYGEFPSSDLDHINRVRTDNRISNLRLATRALNSQNRGIHSNNKTGFAGVVAHKTGKFQSQIKANGKYKYLGLFATAEEANTAYQRAKSELHGA